MRFILVLLIFMSVIIGAYSASQYFGPKKECSLRPATAKEYMDCFNGVTTGFDNGDCNHACD